MTSLADRLRSQANEMLALAELLDPTPAESSDLQNVVSIATDAKGMADRIRQRLSELGVTARNVSLRTGREADLIRNILRAADGGRPYHPRVDTLQLLAAQLDVDPLWLLGRRTAA